MVECLGLAGKPTGLSAVSQSHLTATQSLLFGHCSAPSCWSCRCRRRSSSSPVPLSLLNRAVVPQVAIQAPDRTPRDHSPSLGRAEALQAISRPARGLETITHSTLDKTDQPTSPKHYRSDTGPVKPVSRLLQGGVQEPRSLASWMPQISFGTLRPRVNHAPLRSSPEGARWGGLGGRSMRA